MYIIKNKILTDATGSPFKTVSGEIFLTADLLNNIFNYSDYVDAVKSNLTVQVVKLYLLNSDETPLIDVSEYLLSGNLSYNYQKGQTHSLNITLANFDNFWSVHPVLGNLWRGTKFRLDIGLFSSNNVYWRQCGIFVTKDINVLDQPENTISLQLYDKFALLDGKIGGSVDSDLKIPVNTNLVSALNMCLKYEYDKIALLDGKIGGSVDSDLKIPVNTNLVSALNYGNIFDSKPIVFEKDISSIKTPYTITKTGDTTIGDVMIELADMVSSDIFYNQYGNLTLRPGVDESPLSEHGIAWHYNEEELLYSSSHTSIDGGAIVNKFIVKGAIENGKQFKGAALNTNPYSPSNVFLNPINSKVLEDKNIVSDDLAQERAEYELQNCNLNYMTSGFQSIFVPHLQPKDVVSWTNKSRGIINEKYVLTSLSFTLGDGSLMSIEMAKVQEVAV